MPLTNSETPNDHHPTSQITLDVPDAPDVRCLQSFIRSRGSRDNSYGATHHTTRCITATGHYTICATHDSTKTRLNTTDTDPNKCHHHGFDRNDDNHRSGTKHTDHDDDDGVWNPDDHKTRWRYTVDRLGYWYR
jgi:hypothetical protein